MRKADEHPTVQVRLCLLDLFQRGGLLKDMKNRPTVQILAAILVLAASLLMGVRLLAHTREAPNAAHRTMTPMASSSGVSSSLTGSGSGLPSENTGAHVTWSTPRISQVLFPGSSVTVIVTFWSDQSIGPVNLVLDPSLAGIVSVAPTSFVQINSSQKYQLAVSLRSPATFQKRGFGGTIHVTSGTGPASASYGPPVEVNLRVDFSAYESPTGNFSLYYPSTWQVNTLPTQTYFTAPPEIDVLDIFAAQPSGGTLQDIANGDIAANDCPGVDATGQPNDRVISSSVTGILYVLSCSAMSERYYYAFVNSAGQVVRLGYHDDFDETETQNQKLATFTQIINSIHN